MPRSLRLLTVVSREFSCSPGRSWRGHEGVENGAGTATKSEELESMTKSSALTMVSPEYHTTSRIWPVVGSLCGSELTQILISSGAKRSRRRIIGKVREQEVQEQGQTGGRVMSPS